MVTKTSSKLIFSTIFAFGLNGQTLAAPSLTSHEAIYELDLKSSMASAEVLTIDGKTHYTLKKVCDGWTSSENYAISFGFENDGVANFISHYKTWESEDGSSFTYDIIENSDALGEKSFEGFANSMGELVEAFHSDGDGEMRKLPEDTKFPIYNMLEMIEQARENAPVFNRSHLFFGGEIDDSLYYISAIMGKKKTAAPKKGLAKTMGDLAEDSYWPLSIAYYDPQAQGVEPEYAIAFQLQDNGIIRGYIVDYGSFKMRATLKKLDQIDPEPCE